MRSLFVILPLVTLGWLATVNTVRAQEVSTDGTLSTTVRLDGSNFIIENGNRAGGNLFHSFSQFSVPNGRSAVFQNPVDVQNIISRVTGGSISNIDGLIRAQGRANLFLLNPAGIAFGSNARLNIGGSFFATTANSLLFGDGVEFSATNLATPPVLTVNIPIGLRFRDNPGNISANNFGLEVQPGNTLALIGGNVNLDSGILFAPGGRIELGGLTQAGTIGLNPDNSLSFPDGVVRGDVAINNGIVSVFAVEGNSGDINIQGKSVSLSDNTQLIANHIGQGNAGNISVKAQDAIRLDNSFIFSDVGNSGGTQSNGNVGKILIEGRNVSLSNGSQLQAGFYSNSQGNPGSVTLRAKESVSLANSSIFTDVLSGTTGNGSNIEIVAGSISLSDESLLRARNQGQGNAGNINITATDGSISLTNRTGLETDSIRQGNAGNVVLKAQDAVRLDNSSIVSDVGNSGGTRSVGNVGKILVEGRNVSLNNRSSLQAGFYSNSQGNPGSVTVRAKDKVSFQNSFIYADVYPNAVGDGSNIDISAKSVFVTDGALLNTSNQGQGNAGNIDITTGLLFVSGGGRLNSNTLGAGKGGNLNVSADTIELIGSSADGQFLSGLFAQANRGSTGNAGDLTIKTQKLFVRDGARVSASTLGAGKGGNLNVSADTIELIGSSADGQFSSGLFARSNSGSTGNAGDLTIKTQKLFVRDGAQVSASTFGAGNGGNLTVTAETVELIGSRANGQFPSGLFAQADSDSKVNAGNLTIKTQKLFVRNGAQVSASTFGAGNGGNLTVTAETVELIGSSADQFSSGLFAQANPGSTGDAGDLTINTQNLFVRDGAQVSAGTLGAGKGGNLTVTAETVELIGSRANGQFPSGLFTRSNSGSKANAGDLTINTQNLFVRDGAQVSASTFGAGNGGNLTVTADTVELIGSTSGLFAQANRGSTGNAGDLTINTQQLFVRDGAGVFVRSLGTGNAGNLQVNARSIKLDNQGTLTASTSSGDGGNITLNVRDYLFMRRNSNITASGGNDGGNIFINNDPGYRGFVIATPMQNSDITANASTGQGGKVIINSYGIFGFVPRSREDSELSSNGFDPSKLPTNDITAISQQSPTLSGTVEINTLDVDPSQGLLELQANLTDPSSQIAQNPCQKGFGSSFIITGRGGLPSSPNDSLSNDNVRVGLVNPSTSTSSSQSSTINQPKTQSAAKQIIPAQGWIFNDKGEVVLTAYDPTTTNPQRTSQPTAACPAF
ncbi:hypothetical protein B4U84_17495 [Westiellopsis prolifica IICB1]|nr:hypothetical protein B4U84_17495 [Westiellopsis prolifica IICB1]